MVSPLEHMRLRRQNNTDIASHRIGLFTARSEEPSWAVAHRILIPTFGPLSIRDMFPGMEDIASQLIAKVTYKSIQRMTVLIFAHYPSGHGTGMPRLTLFQTLQS